MSKKALVTGAKGGIGSAITKGLVDAGFRVMEEDDVPKQEKTDIFERLKHGSNFNVKQF